MRNDVLKITVFFRSPHRILGRLVATICMVVACLLLAACDADDDFDAQPAQPPEEQPEEPVPDTTAPTVQVSFPGLVALTEGGTMLVTGTASDVSPITSVSVNGIEATTQDSYAHWQATVPLDPGVNELTVSTMDELSNTNTSAATLSIDYGPLFDFPEAVAVDMSNNRALVADTARDAIYAVDLATGARSVLSDSDTPNSDNPLAAPRGIVVDAANNRALVADAYADKVVAVDLDTGERSVLADLSGEPLLVWSIALDSANNRALIGDPNPAIWAVDLTTGAYSVFSNDGTPDNVNNLRAPWGIDIDTANNRALVADRSSVMGVDLTTGARTYLWNRDSYIGDNPPIDPLAIAVDAANNRALVLDIDLDVIAAVDLTTGEHTFLGDGPDSESAVPLPVPYGIAVDVAYNRALVADRELSYMVAVDLLTGERSIMAGGITPAGSSPMTGAADIVVDDVNNRALVVDGEEPSTVLNIDLDTGARSLVFGWSSEYYTIESLVLDSAADSLIIVSNSYDNRLLDDYFPEFYWPESTSTLLSSVDLTTGVLTDLASTSRFSGLPRIDLDWPVTIDLLPETDKALVLDTDRRALVSIDLSTGVTSVLSDNDTPNTDNAFVFPTDFELDIGNNRALVLDIGRPALLAIDLNTGIRTVISTLDALPGGVSQITSTECNPEWCVETPVNLRYQLARLALDIEEEIAFVANAYPDAVLEIDLATGSSAVLSDDSMPGPINAFSQSAGIAFDPIRDRVLVTEGRNGWKGVYAVEPETGERAIISR